MLILVSGVAHVVGVGMHTMRNKSDGCQYQLIPRLKQLNKEKIDYQGGAQSIQQYDWLLKPSKRGKYD